jgi:hypothetical protein
MPTLMEVHNFRSLLLLHHTTCKQTKLDEIINWNITSKEKNKRLYISKWTKSEGQEKLAGVQNWRKEIKDAPIVGFHTNILGYII